MDLKDFPHPVQRYNKLPLPEPLPELIIGLCDILVGPEEISRMSLAEAEWLAWEIIRYLAENTAQLAALHRKAGGATDIA